MLLKTRKRQVYSRRWLLSTCSHNSVVEHVLFSFLSSTFLSLSLLSSPFASASNVPPFIRNLTSFLSIVQSFWEREVSLWHVLISSVK
jgi:hypothetical protein